MDVLDLLHPITRRWFEGRFASPTVAQQKGWPCIREGASTLLLAPTGSGKTLTAFLLAIDRMIFGPREGEGVGVLYITPLKALGVDVERNLHQPLDEILALAEAEGVQARRPSIGVRSGDTTPKERARQLRKPPEILITTPESLYLMLSSKAQASFAGVRSVIIDEIHALVPTKRGVHLALSLERLEELRSAAPPLQRIGLSATQRPLDEVARFLGGRGDGAQWRPVEIVDAAVPKAIDLCIEVPVEDMARLPRGPASTGFGSGEPADPSGTTAKSTATGAATPAAEGAMDGAQGSIWDAVHPRLVELIRSHRSTMIFANSRRLAERLAGAINELAGEELVLAHHGSVAKDQRAYIEGRLKAGELPGIVCTSSLELGIDVGAIDLVVQIEAPQSVASGLQRIGRAGHQVGATSKGIVFPKFRGDLLACAALGKAVLDGKVEATFYPRHPLDVLAQQIVAMLVAAPGPLKVDEVATVVRRAAPYAELPERALVGVLDMLSGRFRDGDLGDLRARITWDRRSDELSPRKGSRLLVFANPGTIPDRGLYGVFLANTEKPVRVGELDEEMVFESAVGDVFLLGASSWKVEEITHDRVLVSPAPGMVGRMPFWRGEGPGRPVEFGRAIGELTRTLVAEEQEQGEARLQQEHALDPSAAANLCRYLQSQREATGVVPSDRTVVVERFVDEVGDWRVCVLSPFGSPVHAPWASAVAGRLMDQQGIDADVTWNDDGIVFRFPEADAAPPASAFLPPLDELDSLLEGRLGETALFAARFRENAGRALLLPRRRPGQRMPLWAQRRKSARLLSAASRFADFPIVLETYRECLRDVFDLPALREILGGIEAGNIDFVGVETKKASPFAASVLFHYVANFMYELDAPLAERRAQALQLDHDQLRELLGEPELRLLLAPKAIAEVEASLQRRSYEVQSADGLHDLLLSLGAVADEELCQRGAAAFVPPLVAQGRVAALDFASGRHWVAVEDAAAYRDALGVDLPPLPAAFEAEVPRALEAILHRHACRRGPFALKPLARSWGLGIATLRGAAEFLQRRGDLQSGAFLPDGDGEEWVAPEVLRRIKRRSLALARSAVKPVPPEAYVRFLLERHGVAERPARPASSDDVLLDVVAQLQGAALVASTLEREILPARIPGYRKGELGRLCAAGEVLWRGVASLPGGGEEGQDGRIALYLREDFELLAPPAVMVSGEQAAGLRELLRDRGALFFRDIQGSLGGLRGTLLDTLWEMVWAGEVGCDSLSVFAPSESGGARRQGRGLRQRRGASWGTGAGALGMSSGSSAAAPGRFFLLPKSTETPTSRMNALAQQLLERHGVLTREAIAAELQSLGIAGGFSGLYPVLRAMEDAGTLRRGYFVEDLGATQFALPGCPQQLRRARNTPGEHAPATVLSATDPAQPFGAALPWDALSKGRQERRRGAQVVISEGRLLGFLNAKGDRLTLHEAAPASVRAVAQALREGVGRPRGKRGSSATALKFINGERALESKHRDAFEAEGFRSAGDALFVRHGAASL